MADEEAPAQDTAPAEAAPPAAAPAQDTTVAIGTAFLAAPGEAERQPHEDPWEAPRSDDQGFALDTHEVEGELVSLPINRRLRGLALARAGLDTDPGGSISPEDIADAAGRIAAYAAAYPPLAKLTTAELEKRAEAERVDISGASTNDERASLIAAKRPELV